MNESVINASPCSKGRTGVLRSILPAGIFALAMMVFAGCEEEVTDLRLIDNPFTMYAIVNPKADTQFVRVFAVTDTPAAYSAEPLAASVRFIDLESDAVFEARDSTVSYSNGRFGHVYWATFRPEFDRSYRVEVRHPDGVISHGSVRTPPPSEIAMLEPIMRFDEAQRDRVPFQPVMLRRTDGVLQRVEAVYYVEAQNIGRRYHAIGYDQEVDSQSDGWLVELDLVRDYNTIYEEWEQEYRLHQEELQQQGVECCRIEFYGLEVRATVVDTAWIPPVGGYDPDVLVQPGTMDNVQNGFGFVGAGYEEESEVRLSRCFQYWTGYVFADDPCSDADYCTYRGQRCGE